MNEEDYMRLTMLGRCDHRALIDHTAWCPSDVLRTKPAESHELLITPSSADFLSAFPLLGHDGNKHQLLTGRILGKPLTRELTLHESTALT